LVSPFIRVTDAATLLPVRTRPKGDQLGLRLQLRPYDMRALVFAEPE